MKLILRQLFHASAVISSAWSGYNPLLPVLNVFQMFPRELKTSVFWGNWIKADGFIFSPENLREGDTWDTIVCHWQVMTFISCQKTNISTHMTTVYSFSKERVQTFPLPADCTFTSGSTTSTHSFLFNAVHRLITTASAQLLHRPPSFWEHTLRNVKQWLLGFSHKHRHSGRFSNHYWPLISQLYPFLTIRSMFHVLKCSRDTQMIEVQMWTINPSLTLSYL